MRQLQSQVKYQLGRHRFIAKDKICTESNPFLGGFEQQGIYPLSAYRQEFYGISAHRFGCLLQSRCQPARRIASDGEKWFDSDVPAFSICQVPHAPFPIFRFKDALVRRGGYTAACADLQIPSMHGIPLVYQQVSAPGEPQVLILHASLPPGKYGRCLSTQANVACAQYLASKKAASALEWTPRHQLRWSLLLLGSR